MSLSGRQDPVWRRCVSPKAESGSGADSARGRNSGGHEADRSNRASAREVLVSAGVLVQLPCGTDSAVLNRITDRIRKAVEKALSGENLEWSQQHLRIHHLEEPQRGENARRCSHCGAWATDRYRLGAIESLPGGCETDGLWVCERCLSHV